MRCGWTTIAPRVRTKYRSPIRQSKDSGDCVSKRSQLRHDVEHELKFAVHDFALVLRRGACRVVEDVVSVGAVGLEYMYPHKLKEVNDVGYRTKDCLRSVS